MAPGGLDKFKVFLRYDDIVIAVLLPQDINFGNLVRYVCLKFKVEDRNAIRLSYFNGGTKRSIFNEEDTGVFKTIVLGSPECAHTIIVENTVQTPQVNSDPEQLSQFSNVSIMPAPPHFPSSQNNLPCKSNGGLKRHHLFENKDEAVYAISLKCLTEGYEFYVFKSCTARYSVKCVKPECDWGITCHRITRTERFRITKINDKHKCSKIIFKPNHRNAYAKTLARILAPKIADMARVYRPKDIIHDLSVDMNIDVSYKRAWRARHLALQTSQGCSKASFSQLPLYCYNLKLANSGTVTHIENDDAGRFKNLFIGFGAAVSVLFTL